MKTAFYIARRYLISKKSVNLINLISGISVAGVTIGTFALIVILSVFNGMEASIKSLFSSFDPDIKITAAVGKSFPVESIHTEDILKINEVQRVTPVIEENALLRYGDRQYFVTLKGVPSNYNEILQLDSSFIPAGKFILEANQLPFAVVGQGVAYYLSVGMNFTEPIHVYALKKGATSLPTLTNSFKHTTIYASGIFQGQQEIDSRYVLVPFEFTRELFEMDNRVTSVEVGLKPGADADQLKKKIAAIIGDQFVAKTESEQHELFYKVMQSEKWAIFVILAFVLLIASFNILGSLSMLIIDKKEDITILQSMGASKKLVRLIFLFEGWLISVSGAIFGLILGVVVCWIQIRFGILRIPGNDGSFIFSTYPVEVRFFDLINVFLLVAGIGFLAAWYPIRFISGKYLKSSDE